MNLEIRKIDLHMHTTVSDGTDTPSEILSHVKDTGLDLFAVTDHDAIKASLEIPPLLTEGKPRFLTGIEFSCRDRLGKYHILGYGYDPAAAPIKKVVGMGHAIRVEKLYGRLDALKAMFGFEFSEEDVMSLLKLQNPGKPHIGNMMVKYGYADSKEAAIHDYLNKIHLGVGYVKPEAAIEGILGSGGIPVLAHPSYGSGEELIVGLEMEERLRRLMGFGIMGIEAYYSGFTRKLMNELFSYAEKYNLYVTAGSDYHGKNKLIPLGDTNLEDVSEGVDGLHRFLEAVSDRII